MLEGFKEVELQHPIHEAILVGVTDAKPAGYIEEVPNPDGFFQVLAGCDPASDEDELTRGVLAILRRATVEMCPFADADRVAFKALFDEFE